MAHNARAKRTNRKIRSQPLRMLARFLKPGSPAFSIYTGVEGIWIKCNELALNIHTDTEVRIERRMEGPGNPFQDNLSRQGSEKCLPEDDNQSLSKRLDSRSYSTPDYWYVYKVARLLKLDPEDVFFDIGCGMGRILCVLARHKIRKCVGIELFEDLCEAARSNGVRLRGRKAPIEIIRADAAVADLSEGTVYFMFNPFGAETLRDVLDNIGKSLTRNPRDIKIVYYNSVHEACFQSSAWLQKFHSFNTITKRKVTFWKNFNCEIL